jgi:regulator of replication initiation timing
MSEENIKQEQDQNAFNPNLVNEIFEKVLKSLDSNSLNKIISVQDLIILKNQFELMIEENSILKLKSQQS